MKICRFNNDRVGIVDGDGVIDVTDLFDRQQTWPVPPGDTIIRQIDGLKDKLRAALASDQARTPLSSVRLESPVANPSKIVGAPINYKAHIEEANADSEISHGHVYTSLDQYGLFLKANTSLIGVADEVEIRFADRRTDHEVELAVVIGREARMVTKEEALDYVLGYAVGLDMTVRGKEFPTFRKSVDTYCVLGPWIITTDEVADPNALELTLTVNGEARQGSNTSKLIFNVQRLIEYASSFYTLYPGDVIMTGTPDGVGPVEPGDVMDAEVEGVAKIQVRVAAGYATADRS
jgi:2-keto-4-pentenoate hydratase/2-oxohepta-3-ene-1,7-dioic acid hydratase in catechol pathway